MQQQAGRLEEDNADAEWSWVTYYVVVNSQNLHIKIANMQAPKALYMGIWISRIANS